MITRSFTVASVQAMPTATLKSTSAEGEAVGDVALFILASFLAGHDADVAAVLQDGEVDVGDAGAAAGSQRGHQLVPGDLLRVHRLIDHVAVADEDGRPALDEAF